MCIPAFRISTQHYYHFIDWSTIGLCPPADDGGSVLCCRAMSIIEFACKVLKSYASLPIYWVPLNATLRISSSLYRYIQCYCLCCKCTLSETRTVVWNDFLLNLLTAWDGIDKPSLCTGSDPCSDFPWSTFLFWSLCF